MPNLEEILTPEGNVPVMLMLKDLGRAYKKQLERKIGVHGETIKKSVTYLIEIGMVEKTPYDGKVPNVDSWLVLTDLGEHVADCLADCRKKLSAMKRG